MKLTKKLLPALGMLALSTCMMVTSTFAWFSMNTTVRATGMSVSAKGDQIYLQIVNDGETFSNTDAQIVATAQNAHGQNLKPTNVVEAITQDGASFSAYDGSKAFKWVTNNSATVNSATGVGGYTEASSTGYYLTKSFKIRLNEQAGKTESTAPLKVSSVEFTNKQKYTDSFAHCVSVLVVCGNYSQLYKQTSTTTGEGDEATTTYNIGTFDMVEGSYDYLSAGASAADSSKMVFNSVDGVKVDVYVFFDGENPNCTIAQLDQAAKNADGYAIDVFFTCI